jgi:hypothetical protein
MNIVLQQGRWGTGEAYVYSFGRRNKIYVIIELLSSRDGLSQLGQF